MALESLGIIKVESVHWYVKDMARTRRFYTELMDFAELGEYFKTFGERLPEGLKAEHARVSKALEG